MSAVLIDRKAVADLVGIAEHIGIEKQRPKAARRFLDQIASKFDLYASQPELGQLCPELGEGIRSFVFKKQYVVIYRPLLPGRNRCSSSSARPTRLPEPVPWFLTSGPNSPKGLTYSCAVKYGWLECCTPGAVELKRERCKPGPAVMDLRRITLCGLP